VAFGRRRKDAPHEDESNDSGVAVEARGDDPVAEGDDESAAPAAPVLGSGSDGSGPFDAEDAPGEVPEGWGRIDLGSLRLGVPAGVEVRLDVDQASGMVNAAVVVLDPLALQVMAYAAPRTLGIWDDIREQIRTSLTAGGGVADEVTGIFGPELRAQVPAEGGRVEARFLGVDGPRWFLRGVVSGPGAHDDTACALAFDIFAATVVARDDEARPSQEPLPVVLPKGATPGA
jgi:hypothetical protein